MFRNKQFLALMAVLTLSIVGFVFAQQTFDLSQKLPVDPNVTIGQFDNGLKYYIRVNEKPENRAELRLVLNAGAVLEDSSQQGYAHLGEHMAFNGTKNFEKQELIDYLESIGMKFGPDINAGTSYDFVYYMLQLPTDSLEQFEKGFQILEDRAHQVSYKEEEINKERGVVIEEWRLYRGPYARMQDEWFPVLFKSSKYAERNIIGPLEILQSDDNDEVRRFYNEWYRPDLMAVIAVGDFDPDYVKELLDKHFATIPELENPRERQYFPVPDHEETLYAITTDPETPRTSVSIYFKRDVEKDVTIGDYRQNLVESLYSTMLNNRLDELRQEADPPFMYAYTGSGRLIQTKDVYQMVAGVKEDGIERGLESLFTEALRVKRHGFVQSELDRAKASLLRSYERAFNERDKTESRRLADEYRRNYLYDESIPGIEMENEYAKAFVPGVTLEEVNNLVDEYITDGNRVVVIQAPEKENVVVPTEQNVAELLASVSSKDVEAYTDNVSDEPLIPQPPKPGKIVNERNIESLDVVEWTLSNGTRVMLKSTDFKNDEIRFQEIGRAHV